MLEKADNRKDPSAFLGEKEALRTGFVINY